MSTRKLLLWSVLLAFAAYSTWALFQVGYLGIWQSGLTGPGALQILLDLVIACGVFIVWMLADARQRQITAWPWILAILATGTIAILVYLLVREYTFDRQTARHQTA